jgi:predicted secreted protein
VNPARTPAPPPALRSLPSPRGPLVAALLGAALAGCVGAVNAQTAPAESTLREPVVTVSASATADIANDRLRASLRAEADHASAAAAASEVNARMGRALARAKRAPGIAVQTSGYSSYQVSERDRPSRWRVAQTLVLDGRDFAAMTDLVSALQAEVGLVVAGIQFSVSDEAQRQAEDALTQQAIKHWQDRAARAAQGLGFAGWRPGRVSVQTGEQARPPYPVMRAAAAPASGGAPVAFEAGATEVTVTVSGEAVAEGRLAPLR